MSLTNIFLLSIAICLLAITVVQILSYLSRKHKTIESGNRYNSNAWSAIRDIFIASMTKGQLPMAILGIIGIIIFAKIPGDKTPSLIKDCCKAALTLGGLGWTLLFFVTCLSITSSHKLKELNAKQKETFQKEKEAYLKQIADLKQSEKK